MKIILSFILAFFCIATANGQVSAEDYGLQIYKMIISGDRELSNEFVDLQQYSAYIDNLNSLPEDQKENIKRNAAKSYSEVRHDFDSECNRIISLYVDGLKTGTTFTFSNCAFEIDKQFPNIGMITCYYIADIPEEEEPVADAIKFECIKTDTGWRILDGFFDETYANR